MSDLTIFGKTYTDVKGIKATDTDGNAVVYGGGYSFKDIAERSEPSGHLIVPSDVTNLSAYVCNDCKGITEVTIEGNPLLGNACFQGCSNLGVLHAPNLTRIFRSNTISSYYAFNGTALKIACFPSYGNYVCDSYTFQNCSKLEIVDFADCHSFGATFNNTPLLRTMILRRTGTITVLRQSGANGTGGIYQNPLDSSIYVPQALISAYQTASNWSALYALNNDIFKPIEGSIYETQYADGTPIE